MNGNNQIFIYNQINQNRVRYNICLSLLFLAIIMFFNFNLDSVYSTPDTSELSFEDEDWSAISLDRYEPEIINIDIDPDPANPKSNIDIFAHVNDEFGEIVNASMLYSSESQNITKNLPMELYYGNLSYGVFHTEIPALNNTYETTINATLFFEDNLGYNTSYDFYENGREIAVSSKVDIGTATNTTNFETNKTTTITVPLQTFGTELQNVTLYYTTENEEWDSELTEEDYAMISNWTSVMMSPVDLDDVDENEPEVDDFNSFDYLYKADMEPLPLDSEISYWVEVYDTDGNNYRYTDIKYFDSGLSDLETEEDDSNQETSTRPYLNKVYIKSEVGGIDTKNFSTNLNFILDSDDLDNRSILGPLQTEIYKIGSDGHVVDTNQMTSFALKRIVDNSEIKIQNQNKSIFNRFNIEGTPSAYPFDEYQVNLRMAIPVKNTSLDTDLLIDNSVNTSWASYVTTQQLHLNDTIAKQTVIEDCQLVAEIKNSMLCENGQDIDNMPTILNVNFDFKRNHSISIIILPLLASFFLLGAIFIFDASTDIGNRLAVTLGVIALIFTLPEIINLEKPASSGSTIADSMISIIIIAAISFTVSSIISSNSKVQSKLKHWHWIDRLVYFLVSSIIIYYFVVSDYPRDIIVWLIPLLLVALGYGLLLRLSPKKTPLKRKVLTLGLVVIGTILSAALVNNYYSHMVLEKDSNLSNVFMGPKVIYAGNSSYDKDIFNITKLWPTKSGGQEWFSNEDRIDDDIQLRHQPREMSDRYYIDTMDYATNKGNITTTNHKEIAQNGYMYNQTDWKNIEFTAYVNASQVSDIKDDIEFIVRGEKHVQESDYANEGCRGSAYRGQISFEGYTKFLKEQYHGSSSGDDSHAFNSSNIKKSIDLFSNKWIGIKMVVYNFNANGKENVNMELWIDENNNGNWKKVHQWIDSGKWGDRDRRCGGEPDQIITWGGPIAQLRIDGADEVNVKNLSIREIDPKIT